MAGYGNGYGPSGQGQDIPMQDRSHCKYPPSLQPWYTGEFLSRCQKAQWCELGQTYLAIQITCLVSVGHWGWGGGAVRTVQIKSWHDRPHLMSLLSWVDKSIKPSNCYYSDTWLLKYSQALQLDMAHFLFNCWNMTCFSCSGFSVLYIDILYIDMKLRHTSIKRSSL